MNRRDMIAGATATLCAPVASAEEHTPYGGLWLWSSALGGMDAAFERARKARDAHLGPGVNVRWICLPPLRPGGTGYVGWKIE